MMLNNSNSLVLIPHRQYGNGLLSIGESYSPTFARLHVNFGFICYLFIYVYCIYMSIMGTYEYLS